MFHNQMTYNGLPPSSSSSPSQNFFQQSFLFNSSVETEHTILPSTPCINSHDFGGVQTMLGKRSVWSEEIVAGGGNGVCEEELSDDCSLPGEKKRRLNMDQVRTLERNFELGNKLEPERKLQLARALGLQPRQIAIWFQNRRARWKTKQLEKDYESLKREFELVRLQNESLHLQNKKLQAEVLSLKGKEGGELINLNKETEGSCSNRSENSCDINLDISRTNVAIEGDLNQTQISREFFPSYRSAPIVTQLPKIENAITGNNEENFCNIFCGVDEPSAFWPWTEN